MSHSEEDMTLEERISALSSAVLLLNQYISATFDDIARDIKEMEAEIAQLKGENDSES